MNFPHPLQLHFWYTRLNEDLYDNQSILLLSADEVKRAQRLKFTLHRKRFITARAALRSIMGLYLNTSPKEIHFLHSLHGKPYLENTTLTFNLSHSHDFAIYVFSSHMKLGLDIEKIQPRYNTMIVKRFFSSEEYAHFSTLPPAQQLTDFYRIWTGKEALVKAQGEKLSTSLSMVTLPSMSGPNQLIIKNASPEIWYLENLALFPGYYATVVTDQLSTHHSFWEWTDQGEKKWLNDSPRIT